MIEYEKRCTMLQDKAIKKTCRIFLVFDIVVMISMICDMVEKEQTFLNAFLKCITIMAFTILYWLFVWNILPEEYGIERKLKKNEKVFLAFIVLIKGFMYVGLIGMGAVNHGIWYIVLCAGECILIAIDVIMNFVASKFLIRVNQRERSEVEKEKIEYDHHFGSKGQLLVLYCVGVIYIILSMVQIFMYVMEYISFACIVCRALCLGIILDSFVKNIIGRKESFADITKMSVLFAAFVIELGIVLMNVPYVYTFVCIVSTILFEALICDPIGKEYYDQINKRT